jgi:hypothetical protein
MGSYPHVRVAAVEKRETDGPGDIPPYGDGLGAGEELGPLVKAGWHKEVRHGEGKRRGPQGGRRLRHHRLLARAAQETPAA